MRSIDSIAEDYVERAAALNPALASYAGIAGHDGELPDLTADGFAERAGLDRATLAALGAAEAPGLREQTARAAMQERLALAVERYDAGDTTSELNVIASWVHDVRELFDLMPAEGEEAAATVARRMAAVPEAYRQLSQTLLGAARNGRPPARLQVEEVAKQCDAWGNWTQPPARRRPPRPGSANSCAASCCRWPARRTPADRRSTPGRQGTSSAPPWTWRRPTPGAGRRSPGYGPSKRASAA
jgi:uncharacterized protein (DUF885 family)